ncbi:MAG: hypothetical protein J5I91_09420 [Bacteroidetes bacterium]|nr:hypothetical protein [Bacteroidota bacterium]
MKNLKLLITGVLIACFAVSFTGCCCKDNCPPCGNDYLQIPKEMKEWALFEEGSWWVYRLAEDTTVFDTVRVVPNSLRDFRSNKSKCYDNNSLAVQCSETLTYDLQHSNIDYFPHHADTTIGGFDEINLYYPPGGVFLKYNNGAAPLTSGVIFGIEPIKIGEHYGNFTLVDTLINFDFNNILVKHGFNSAKNSGNSPIPKTFDKVYWGKNIGLLKIQITHSNGETKNWELINYEVKQ